MEACKSVQLKYGKMDTDVYFLFFQIITNKNSSRRYVCVAMRLVLQVAEVLNYKPEGCEFDSRRGH
jgi:hypothetical protein